MRFKKAAPLWARQGLSAAVELTGITEEFVRRAFTRVLADDETTKKFCGSEKNRSLYLDHLPFEERSRHADDLRLATQSSEDVDGEYLAS
jgi:hypothetical protein